MSVKGMVVVMTFSVMAWKSLGLKWTTEELHTNCCEGQDKILMWNYSLEKNETVQHSRWFFNLLTAIAYESEPIKFLVAPSYMGRVEQIGKMGILLKNVSSVDTGNYSLYLNLGPESPANMQTIFLTVFESPTYQCKPSITKYPENVLFCLTNSCGGIKLSTEWKISEKYDFTSSESYLNINSSWNAEVVSCCLHRQIMQCQNGNLSDFCASTIISFAEDKHDSKTNYAAAVLAPVITGFISFVVGIYIYNYRKKICKSCAMQRNDTNMEMVPNMELEARSLMGGAMQRNDTNMEMVPNMELEARSLMGGAMQDKDANKELEPNMEPEAHPLMGGAMQDKDANKELEPNMEPEAHPLMGGAMQDKGANKELEPNMEPEAHPLMGGAMQDKGANKELEPNMEPEAHPLMGGAMQDKDANKELESIMEPEARPLVGGTRPPHLLPAVLLVEQSLEQDREGGSMMEGTRPPHLLPAVLLVEQSLEQDREGGSMMEGPRRNKDTDMAQEHRPMRRGKSSDSETKMSHAPL